MSDETTPAKKRVRNRKPKSIFPAPIVPGENTIPATGIMSHTADDTGIIPPKPPHDFSRGEKTPAVIRWRRDYCPETMAATYRGWDWQAYLDSNPPE